MLQRPPPLIPHLLPVIFVHTSIRYSTGAYAFYNINKCSWYTCYFGLRYFLMLLLFLRYFNAIIPVWFSDLDTPTLSIYYLYYAVVMLFLFLRYSNAITTVWSTGLRDRKRIRHLQTDWGSTCWRYSVISGKVS